MSDSDPTLEEVNEKVDRFQRLLAGEVKPEPVRRPRRSVALDRIGRARHDSERRQQSRLANPGRDDTDDDDIGVDPDLLRDNNEVADLVRRIPDPGPYRRERDHERPIDRAAREWSEREKLRDRGIDVDALDRRARLIASRGVFEDVGLHAVANGDDVVRFISEKYGDFLAAAIQEMGRET